MKMHGKNRQVVCFRKTYSQFTSVVEYYQLLIVETSSISVPCMAVYKAHMAHDPSSPPKFLVPETLLLCYALWYQFLASGVQNLDTRFWYQKLWRRTGSCAIRLSNDRLFRCEIIGVPDRGAGRARNAQASERVLQ